MSGYSMDLRERGNTAWQNGKRQAWIAETFKISISSIKRYISRFRQMGRVAPTIQQREQPLIKVAQAPGVQAMVDEHPDATLEAYCEDGEQRTGQRVSDSTMNRALERFDRPRKNNGDRRRAG
jgi:transposase